MLPHYIPGVTIFWPHAWLSHWNRGRSTAADPQFTSGTGNDHFTETDLVAGVKVVLNATFRIARDGNNLDITGSISGTPAVIDAGGVNTPGDGVFLEQFALQDVDPAINLPGGGSDNFDFKFNRVGVLVGGNVDLDLTNPVADFNADGTVNDADYTKWTNDFAAGSGSDANADTLSDGTDFLIWQQNYAKTRGHVDLIDFVVTSGTVAAVNSGAVPEPSAAALFALAAFGAARLRRHPYWVKYYLPHPLRRLTP